jgi:hypothetical protein
VTRLDDGTWRYHSQWTMGNTTEWNESVELPPGAVILSNTPDAATYQTGDYGEPARMAATFQGRQPAGEERSVTITYRLE